MLKLKTVKNLKQKNYDGLLWDFKKGETVYLTARCIKNSMGNWGLMCSPNGLMPFSAFPFSTVVLIYKRKNYDFFMREKIGKKCFLYAKTKTDEVLKITEINGEIVVEEMKLKDIEPIF